MKKLKIECFDKQNTVIKKIIAARIDVTCNLTVISTSETDKETKFIRWIDKQIDHWNIIDEMVTVYYKDLSFIEITFI